MTNKQNYIETIDGVFNPEFEPKLEEVINYNGTYHLTRSDMARLLMDMIENGEPSNLMEAAIKISTMIIDSKRRYKK